MPGAGREAEAEVRDVERAVRTKDHSGREHQARSDHFLFTVIRQAHHELGTYWQGCTAGLGALGIEADGAIKGCPSLPTDSYVDTATIDPAGRILTLRSRFLVLGLPPGPYEFRFVKQ